MEFYPQIVTGCLAQYPLRTLHRSRAVVNESPGGERITSFDVFSQALEWDLPYRGLSPVEAGALRALFESCEGRRGDFAFVDPAGNLLARSEEFDQAPWTNAPLLTWTPGIEDPFGGTRGMRVENTSGLPQAFRQTVQIPASYLTCFSVWAKSSLASGLVVRRSSGPEAMQATIPLGAEWRRIETAAALSGTTVGVELTVEIPGAAAVEFFGAQLEPQPAPSAYKRTLAQTALFPAARFLQDEMALDADGYETYTTRMRITARLEG